MTKILFTARHSFVSNSKAIAFNCEMLRNFGTITTRASQVLERNVRIIGQSRILGLRWTKVRDQIMTPITYTAVRLCHENAQQTPLPPYKPLPKKITPSFLRMWWHLSKYMLRSGFFDFNVFKQLNEFQEGFIFTFEFVSKCIAKQTLDEVEAFVSSEVMDRLKRREGIAVSLDHVHPFSEKFLPIFSPLDVVFTGRYLEMSVSFVYVPKAVEGEVEEETQRISMLRKYAHIGLYRFFRPFNKGKPMDDWTVTDIQYITLDDLNKPQTAEK